MIKRRLCENNAMFFSVEKQEIRNLIFDFYPGIPKKYFTFAGEKGKDALLFINQKGGFVRSIERHPIVYKKQLELFKHYANIHATCEDFSHFACNAGIEPPYDIMFFDFQSFITKEIENNLDVLFGNGNFKKGSLIGITLCRARDGFSVIGNTYCIQNVCQGSWSLYKNNRLAAISQTIKSLASKNNIIINEICEARREYQNVAIGKNRGVQMMFLLFKISNIV